MNHLPAWCASTCCRDWNPAEELPACSANPAGGCRGTVLPALVAALVCWTAVSASTAEDGATPAPAAIAAESPVAVPDAPFLAAHGLRYALDVRERPRALRIYSLTIDLQHPDIEIAAVVPDDPDDDGPAETTLAPPLTLAERTGALALINSNPWGSIPDAAGRRSDDWVVGMPVDLCGLVVTDGRLRSSDPAGTFPAFWLDAVGVAHLGQPAAVADARQAVAGFGFVLRDGIALGAPGEDAARHPRTAIGLDATGRWLCLVVVDGRQPGRSEGLSEHELGVCMRELGNAQAINLDGGGSSVMVLADRNGHPRIVNEPSTQIHGMSVPRPLPAMLVVRLRPRDAAEKISR